MFDFAADSHIWRRDLRRTSFCGEVAGFLDPSFHFGTIRQPVLEAHDDCGLHIECLTHKLLLVSVSNFSWSMPSTVKRIPFNSLDVNLLSSFTWGTFTLAGAGLDATHKGGFFFGGIAKSCCCEGVVIKYFPTRKDT